MSRYEDWLANHPALNAGSAQQSSSSGNRGRAPAGNAANGGARVTVLNPDSSAFAANAKDRNNETQRPWYKVGIESYQNADNSAHAQKEKDSYVTDNILYHQWEQQQKGLKADSSAHAQAEKDDEAEKNPLFHQWKTAFDRQQEEKATRNQVKIDRLQKELDELDANSAYITTSDQYDEYQNKRKGIVDEMVSLGGDGKGSGERALSNAWDKTKDFFKGTGSRTTEGLNSVQIIEYNRLLSELDELNQEAAYSSTTAASEEYEQRRKELLTQLHAIDKQAGREERTYDSRERTGAFFKSWGTGTGASYTNAAGNINEITTSAQGMEREIAELETQAARAQTAYDEAVQQYGEAGATFEKNLLVEAQQRLEAKKAQYAGMEKERAYDAKAQAVSQKLYDTADKLLTQSEEEMAKAKYGASGFGSFALDAAKTGLDVAADTVLSAVGVPGLANMAVRVYGSEAQQARLQGDDAQTAAAKGLKSALIEVATEKIAGPFEKAYGKTALSSTINKAVDKLNASGLLKWAADTMGEGFEEGMSDVLNIMADHMMGWDSGENSVWGDIAADKDEIMYDMLLGAFVGAFGATGNAIGARANTSPTAQAQQQAQQTEPVQSAPVQTEATQQAAQAEAVEQVSRVLENGRVNNSTANEIISTPTLADAFYEVTGIALEGTSAAKRETIKTAAREYAYTIQQAEQTAANTLAQRQQTQMEADAAHSQQEAARQAAIEAGVQRGQREAAARERAEAVTTPYDSYIRGLIQNGGSYAEAGEIARTPQLRAAWERMTGITLPDTVSKARDVIMNTRMNVYTPQMNYAQFMADEQAAANTAPSQPNIDNGNANPVAETQPTGDISAPPAVQNVKQTDSRALNNAVNYNSRETQTEAPVEAQGSAQKALTEYENLANATVTHNGKTYDVDNYDKIEDGGRSRAYQTVKPNGRTGQARTVKFSKAVDGTYYVVEAVPDTKAKTVFVTTYLANKKTGDMQTANAEATRVTSETENAQSPVNDTSLDGARHLPNDGSIPGDASSEVSDDISSGTSIPTVPQNVKQNFEGNGLYYRSDLGKGNGTRTTQTVETINNADITTDARREQLSPYIKNGSFDYIPNTNKAQVERATEKIKKDGWAKTVADFRVDVARGRSDADLVALGAVLLNNAGNSEASVAEYMDIYTDYLELTHRTAGALQAAKLAQQLTPEGRLYGLQRVVDRLNEEYKAPKLYAKYADIEIDEKLKSDFLRAKDEATRNKCIDAIQQNIADQMPTTFNEAFTAFRYTAMLGNFKTQERNVLGNAMSLTSKIAKDRLAATIEGAGHFFSGGKMEKTRSVWAGGALYKEAYNDFKAHEAEALGESKYTSTARKTAKEIEDKRTIFKINGDWGKTADSNNAKKLARKAADVSMAALEGWRKATNRTMEMGDAVFSRVAYADAMAGWLKAHKINSFSEATESQLDRARAFAIKEAQEATFRDTNAISELAVSLGSGLKTSQNPVARGLGKVTEGIAPFRKTPANVAVRAVEYSPLGTIETAYKVWQAVNGKANAADVINTASKTLTGTGMFLAGIVLKQTGKLRGKEDDEELDKAQKATGAMDYSYITDKGDYVSLSQFAPMAIPLFMGVRFSELTEDGFDPKDVWAIALGTTDPMLEMSMLQGLNDSLDGISDYGSEQGALGQFLTNALESYISQYVPSVVRHIEQATEEYRQSTYTDKNNPYLSTNAQYWLGKQSAGIPGVDYQQEDYIDMWGRKTKQGEDVERVLNSFFNPVYTSKGKREPLDDELERLYKAGKNIDGFPSVYPDSGSFYQDLDGNGKQMTREQFSNYKISRGTLSRSLARDFIDSEEYKYLNDMERAEVLRDLYKFAADTALRNAQKANGIYSEPDTTYKGISNEDIPEYLATKQVLSDAKNGKTTDWSGVDALLANIKSYSPEVQEKLQTSSGLNVNKLLYADNLGIDSQEWYVAHNAAKENEKATGRSSEWVTADAINTLGGSNEEKFEKLCALVTPDGTNYNRVRGGYTRPSVVRRYDAAINRGVDFDTWTNVEKLVGQLQNGNSDGWGCSKSFITQALTDNGYNQKEIDDIWAIQNASKDYEGVNYLDEYWQQLIDNAGIAATENANEETTENTQRGAVQYTSPIDFLLANTPYK